MRISAASQGANSKSAVNADTEEEPSADSDATPEVQENSNSPYTKSEINRMTTAELQEVAFNNGVEDAYELTGGTLKQLLIEKFGL